MTDTAAPETPQQRAGRLMREIDADPKATYAKGDVKTILNNIAMMSSRIAYEADVEGTCRAPAKVETLRRGDVFIAKLVGGKVRPWIVVRVIGGTVSAVAISSGDSAPGMIASKCRFWPGAWIGTTLSLFEMGFAGQEVTRPYTNAAHLAAIEAHVFASHGIGATRPAKSMADIRERMRA